LGITLGIFPERRNRLPGNGRFIGIGGVLDARRASGESCRMPEFSTSTITVRGCRIRLMRGGAGSPLVVLHGATGANWLPFMQKLAQKFDVIGPEHPGFGESDTPDWLDTIHDLAYFHLDLLEELKLSGVHLVGLSLGGWVAAELAVRSTTRLASLTLAGAAGLSVAGVEQMDPFLRSDEQRLRDFFFDQSKADAVVARALRPEYEDMALKNRTTVAKLTWQPRSHDPHLAKWLHRIDVPTLLIWGDHDRMFPKEHALAYQQLIPGAKVVIIPECGHVPQLEKPDVFAAEIEAFLGARKKAA
jgi:pimeloyl-ACP methyl ester carboxylesterase